MKKNNLLYLFFLIFSSISFMCSANNDSIFIEKVLEECRLKDFKSRNDKIIYLANKFLGVPYGGGTLDISSDETLSVRTDSLDCTTFVETVLAMYVTSNSSSKYIDYCRVLEYIRYRGGRINGYTSRLHYFSDWVYDNSKKGILTEITDRSEHKTRFFSLNYMTSHYELYPHLKNSLSNMALMKEVEKPWENYEMPYIPKERLSMGTAELKVENGDIIALTTSIYGLDVVHLGFVYWINNKLHLLHASSLSKKVIVDETPLYEYLISRKKHTGIRVIRIK